MSCLKRSLDGQDPDYEDNIPHEAKRLRMLEENAKVEFSQRISAIVQQEFGTELANRERDVLEIQERLHEAYKTLHMLRYVIVSAFYNKKQIQACPQEKQKRIHPAVKKLIGKEPRSWEPLHQRPSKYRMVVTGPEEPLDTRVTANENEKKDVTKIPRYIPPKACPKATAISLSSPRRGMHHKVKKRIVIGNISKWVPVDTREDAASHKWMMYVRGPKDAPDVSGFVSKVRFFLHPSYRPHDIAEVTTTPFHLSRRGWGEFPIRVQIHFCYSRNKPVDVIHHLKLDRTYTGLQTLGAETVVDIWLHSGCEPSKDVDSGNTNDCTSVDNTEDYKSVGKTEDCISVGNIEGCTSFSVGNTEDCTSVDKVEDCTSVGASCLDNLEERTSVGSTAKNNSDVLVHVIPKVKVEPLEESSDVIVKEEQLGGRRLAVDQTLTPSSLDHDYVGVAKAEKEVLNSKEGGSVPNHVEEQKLTTLVKCMDRTGHVFYLTLGKPHVKQPTSLLAKHQAPNTTLRNKPSSVPQVPFSIPLQGTNSRTVPEMPKQVQNNSLAFLKLNTSVPALLTEETNKTVARPEQSVLIVKNGQLYLLKHPQTLSALAAGKSSAARPVRGGFSLLKKQTNTLAPVAVKVEDTDRTENNRTALLNRTLVLSKANSRHVNSSKMRYEDALNVAMEHCNFSDVAVAVRWLLRHLPLVSSSAKDPEFRVLHPYAATDDATFLQWNIGKRRAAEWLRAKAVQQVLRQRFPGDCVWRTHAIVVWAKLHGYTPMENHGLVAMEGASNAVRSTYSEPVGIMDWLVTNHKSDRCSESDVEVDVLSIAPPSKTDGMKEEPLELDEVAKPLEVLDFDPEVEAQCMFVRETAREVGFKFLPEEVVPGVLFCTVERLLLEAVRSLADDLLRRSLCRAWRRNLNRQPDCIKREDVQAAILARPELDLFSNRGLGVQVADNS